jgi:hypothetical protein
MPSIVIPLADPMPLESSNDPALRKALVSFLLATFRLTPEAPFVQPALLRWKYDEPRPDWSGDRSFIWNDGEAIAAHACICPVTYRLPSGDVTGSYLIDWAASRTSVGAGVKLLRALAPRFDALFAVGGSPDTRSILPKLGYRHVCDLRFYARVLRPWRQFQTDPFPRRWKAPLRLARNIVWSLAPMPEAPRDWSEQRIGIFESSAQPLFDARADSSFPCSRHTPDLMNYYLRCPSAIFTAALLLRAGVASGWYVLSRVGGQVRIADIWVNSASAADWSAAYTLAAHAALGDPEACELVASASIPPAVEAVTRAGFRFHHAEPVFVLDPRKLFAASQSLNVTFLESDLAYGLDPAYPYLT